jgi:arylsulfatase A
MPILAEICQVPLPKARLNGRSLVGVIRSPDAPSPHDVLEWRQGDQWAVCQGPWKLLHNPDDRADAHKLAPEDKEWFLANVDAAPGERTNVASLHPDIVRKHRALTTREPEVPAPK